MQFLADMAVMPLDGFHQGKQTGIAMTTRYAPWVNLVIKTTTRTSPVSSAPPALINRARRSRDRPSGGVVRSRTVNAAPSLPGWQA